jgi:hypothetical protein
MSCMVSPEFILMMFFIIISPVMILQYILHCSGKYRLLFILLSLSIEFFIIANQSKICTLTNSQIGCSLFFTISITVIIPLILYLLINFYCKKS